MGQYLGALNDEPTQIEEFNIENFQGGLECNVEEVRQKTRIKERMIYNKL